MSVPAHVPTLSAPVVDSDGITILFDNTSLDGKNVDVVFIHGLNGHADKTWTHLPTNFYWPWELHTRLTHSHVMTFGYNAGVKSSIAENFARIKGIATSLLSALANERISSEESRRPLVLIGHSLGGLIAKAAVVIASSNQATQANDLDKLYNSVGGLVFFGTPHGGSKALGKTRVQVLKKMAKAAFTEIPPKLEEALEAGSDELLDLADEFRKLSLYVDNKLFISSFYEQLGTTGLGGRVVDEDSASIQYAKANQPEPINANHIDMVKFHSEEDNNYKNVRKQLARLETKLIERIQEHTFPSKIQEEFDFFDPLKHLDTIKYQKGGPLKGTCTWILSDQNYNTWLDANQCRILWLHGDPGKGKTTLSISLIEELSDNCAQSGEILAYFFCGHYQDPKFNTAPTMLWSLLLQVVRKRPDLIKHLNADYLRERNMLCEDRCALPILWRNLQTMLENGALETVYFVVDALDECERDSSTHFLQHMTVQHTNQALSTKRPNIPMVKWLLTSRNEEHIREILKQSPHISLELNSLEVAKDVELFIKKKVQDLDNLKEYYKFAGLKESLEKSLRTKAEGTFLWVSLACAELRKWSRRDAEEKLEKLPPRLNHLYSCIWNQLRSNREDTETLDNILRAVTAAFRPLTLQELAIVAALSLKYAEDEESLKEEVIECVRECGSFLTWGDTIRFVHESAKEYLRDESPLFKSISLEEVHAALTRNCFQYVCSGIFADEAVTMRAKPNLKRASVEDNEGVSLESDDENEMGVDYEAESYDDTEDESAGDAEESHLNRFHWLEYPVIFWMNHGRESKRKIKEGSFDLSHDFFRPISKQRENWLMSYWSTLHHRQGPPKGFTALHVAAYSGIARLTEMAIANQKAEVDSKDSRYRTPLSWAAEGGYEEVVHVLLRSGADVGMEDREGWTALQFAANRRQRAVVKLLISCMKGQRKGGQAELQWAARKGYAVVAEELLEAGVGLGVCGHAEQRQAGSDVSPEEQNILKLAAEGGHVNVVQLLLQKGARVDARGIGGRTALHQAAWHGYREITRFLLRSGADRNVPDEKGRMALHMAAMAGKVAIVEELLLENADINVGIRADTAAKDNEGMTPLQWAALRGHAGIVKLLVEKGADVNIGDKKGQTAVHMATFEGHIEILRLLLEVKDTAVNFQDEDGMTALHYAACIGNQEAAKLLLEKGANVNLENIDGSTASYVAGLNRDEKIMQLLEEHRDGSNVQSRDAYRFDVKAPHGLGESPLHRAAKNGDQAVARLLLVKGIDVNATQDATKWTALHLAASGGHERVVLLLLENRADMDMKDVSGFTALHLAAFAGCEMTVRWLLEKGAGTDTKDISGFTALHFAAFSGHETVVQLLMERGADVDMPGACGWTALHLAARSGHKMVVELLLAKGADIAATDAFGLRAMHLAANSKHDTIRRRLLEKEIQTASMKVKILYQTANRQLKAILHVLLEKEPDTSPKHLVKLDEVGDPPRLLIRFLSEVNVAVNDLAGLKGLYQTANSELEAALQLVLGGEDGVDTNDVFRLEAGDGLYKYKLREMVRLAVWERAVAARIITVMEFQDLQFEPFHPDYYEVRRVVRSALNDTDRALWSQAVVPLLLGRVDSITEWILSKSTLEIHRSLAQTLKEGPERMELRLAASSPQSGIMRLPLDNTTAKDYHRCTALHKETISCLSKVMRLRDKASEDYGAWGRLGGAVESIGVKRRRDKTLECGFAWNKLRRAVERENNAVAQLLRRNGSDV